MGHNPSTGSLAYYSDDGVLMNANGDSYLLGVAMTGTATAASTATAMDTGDWVEIKNHQRIAIYGADMVVKDCVIKDSYTMPQSRQPAPCPFCGTTNPPDALECGAGRWNGCGAALGNAEK